jgi:hypothetical protein
MINHIDYKNIVLIGLISKFLLNVKVFLIISIFIYDFLLIYVIENLL